MYSVLMTPSRLINREPCLCHFDFYWLKAALLGFLLPAERNHPVAAVADCITDHRTSISKVFFVVEEILWAFQEISGLPPSDWDH